MEMKRLNLSPGTRLETGAAILAAADANSTGLVKQRLSGFAAAQRRFAEAQRKVDGAETRLRTGQARLAACDAEQDAEVEALARALVAEGRPRVNPFAAFGAASPSRVRDLPIPEEVKVIHRLVAAVQRDMTISKATRQAAQAADKAARAVEAACVPLDSLERTVRETRHKRDAVGQTWDIALAAFKRGVRAAADDGAPGLYTALFGRLGRATTKKTRPAPAPPAVNAEPGTAAPTQQGQAS